MVFMNQKSGNTVEKLDYRLFRAHRAVCSGSDHGGGPRAAVVVGGARKRIGIGVRRGYCAASGRSALAVPLSDSGYAFEVIVEAPRAVADQRRRD